MTILAAELKFYHALEVSTAGTNGGRMSANEIISGVVNNVWPHVLQAERTAGSTTWRKIFAKNSNDNDETFLSADLFNDKPTAAGDYIVLFAGTQTDTQTDVSGGSPRLYGGAALKSDVSSGGSTVVVDVEDAAQTGMFQNGDKIRLSDMADPLAGTGNEELLTISGAPTVSGTEVTITVAETIANAYTVAGGGHVSSLYHVGDVKCAFDNWAETCAGSGTYDEAANPPIMDNIGTAYQTWTLTFTDATHYTVSGDTVGSVGSGDTSTDFAPVNSDFSKPWFKLEAAGFAGTWAGSDTIVFKTHPAAAPIWLKRVVPAGTSSLANNRNITAFMGESA